MEIIIKVNSTYNNTIVSALYRGKILKTISTGSLGFKKAKRASTLAAQTCGEALGSWLLQLNKNIALVQKTRKQVDSSNSKAGVFYVKGKNAGVDSSDSSKSNDPRSHEASMMEEPLWDESTLEKETSLELAVLQEAKKKVAGTRLSTNTKKSNVTNSKLAGIQKETTESEVHISNKGLVKQSLNKPTQNTEFVIKQVSLLIAGVGYGKFGVIRGLSKLGIKIKTISDVTAIPHNGCKPPKMRRK